MKINAFASGGEVKSILYVRSRSNLRRLIVCFVFLWGIIIPQVYAQTTVTLDATPKTEGGVTFSLSGNATVAYGAYSFSTVNPVSATISISQKIDISTIAFSWSTNVQGAYLDFYSGATIVKTIPWGPVGTTTVNATGIDRIVMRENGASLDGAGDLQKITFIVNSVASPAIISTTAPSNITNSGVTLGGSVTYDGGALVTERGIVYSTVNSTPTVSNTKVEIGTGTGNFSKAVTGLASNTTYYVRAYAANSAGISYGAVQTFKTLPAPTLPLHTLSFNGTNQFVAVPNKPALEFTTGTVEMWVKPDWTANTKGANPCLISMRSNTGTRYSIHMENNLQGIGIYNGGPYSVKSYSFTKGQWYHIAAVMTTSTTEFFVNGASIGSTSNGINSVTAGLDLKIGASVTGVNSEYFLGEMDEVRVWNTARTANEILYNYGNPVSVSSTGLVAYYSIEENVTNAANAVARKVTESTSNAFHGTLYNYYSSNANLSNLTLSTGVLSPVFSAGTISYAASVPYTVTSVSVTPTVADATAALKVDGASAVSGNAQSINLNVGANTISIAITAQDGTLKNYTVTVIRAAASSNADLSNISLSSGGLTPVFNAGTTSYAATVAHNIASVDLSSTVADIMATLTVDGVAAASGNPVSVALASGSTKLVSVIVTAQNGDAKTYTIAITRPFPPVFASISSSTNVSCNGGANGSATVTASGGTGPFTYSWLPSGGTDATASGLTAGTYTVTVTDANGQTAKADITITQPTALATTGAQTNVSCFGSSNGSATVSVTGGTAPYTYAWSPSGGNAATATGLAAGNYMVTITDAKGCTINRIFTITQPTELAATVATTPVTTVGGNTGTATVTATGGTGAYTYSWSPSGGTGATATGLTAGTYTLTIKDTNNCSITKTVTILEPTVTNVVAITKTATSPTNAATVGFNIVFDQPVTGVSAGNFTLTTSGVSGASIASVAAVNSTTYAVTVNTGTGSGQISLNLVNDDGLSLTVQNLPVNGTEKYTIDKTPPAVPSAPDLLATSDSGSSDSDNITNKTSLTFEGTAEPETSILFYAGTQEMGNTTSDVNGNWQVTATLVTGTHSLTAKAVDALGNSSAASAALLVTVDVTAPAKPFILAFKDENITGGNNGFSKGNVLKLSGSAELGATVKVTLPATSQTKEALAATGAWEIDFSDLALTDGTYTFEGTATDVAGNVSQVSASFALMIDRVAPVAPLIASISEDTGLSNTDAITSDRNIQINGTAEGGSKVTVTIGTDTYSPIIAASDGKWTLDLTTVTLADGTYAATAIAQDAAGNVSDASSTFTFVVDNVVPSAPVIDAVSEDTGVSTTDGITNDQTLTISGTALAQNEVSILLNGTAIGTAVADANGDWTYTYASTILEGVYTLTAKATSVSGIVSSLSAAYTLTVDVTAPTVIAATTAAPVVKAPFDITYTFSEAVSGFELSDLTLTNATATSLSANGNTYTVTISPTTDGKVTAQLKTGTVTDMAGNMNGASELIERLYDVTVPEVTLASSAPQVTNAAFTVMVDFTEPVTGFEEGDLSVTNAAVSSFTKVSEQQYTALITPQTDGNVAVSVAAGVAFDAATNGNEASAILSRTYDATKPTVTLATTAADPTNAPFTVTYIFSEEVFVFELGDITVTNGAASAFTKIDGQTYTALVTPASDGHVTVALAAGVASDKATNPSEASAELRRLYDATAPTGYAIAFNTNRVDVTNVSNISLSITDAEVGTTYFYTIISNNGGTEVTGTTQVQQSGFDLNTLDLSSLNDGTLTATLYLLDAAGNKGANATAEVIKITRDIVAVTVPQVIKVPIRTTYANVPMPAKVEVTYSTGAKEQLNVTWSQGNYNGFVAGSYELTGELILAPMTTNLTQHVAKVTVEVQPNKVPTALAFNTTTFKPEATANDVIGTLTTTDPDDNQFVYTLVSGDGSKDNELFELRGDKLYLKSNKGLSGITQLSIRVRSTDPYSNTIEKNFTLSKELYAKPEDQLKIVNAFSPDGDGINDTWFIPELRFYNNVEIEVFDRSGMRLFYTTNPEEGWNGKDANGQVRKGTYFYIVQVKDINMVKKGVVTILKK
ncbi:Ig-like domain-containing protein [Pontibacter sp. H249]|uniref:Ig-like domain-containing protein n=1 Tax=Pontibacter sp. H249 TaxID=3133420 RepID=UPI0030C29488